MKNEQKNPWESIVCEELILTLRLLGASEKYIDGNASDFEKFREWLSAYPYMSGNIAAEKIREQLSSLTGIEALNAHSARELWRCAMGDIGSFDSEEILYSNAQFANVISCDEKNRILSDIVSLDKILKMRAESFSEFLKMLENTNKKGFLIDAYEGELVRPDRYHANEYYAEYLCGEKLHKNVILLQALLELIYKSKCEIIHINIESEKALSWAGKLVSYLKMRNIDIRILLHINGEISPTAIRNTCLCHKKITPMLINRSDEYIKAFAQIFPIGAAAVI